MNHEDIITISEFVRKPKVFLDTAKNTSVYLRRGLEVFRLEAVKTTFKIDEKAQPSAAETQVEQAEPPVTLGYIEPTVDTSESQVRSTLSYTS